MSFVDELPRAIIHQKNMGGCITKLTFPKIGFFIFIRGIFMSLNLSLISADGCGVGKWRHEYPEVIEHLIQ